MKRVRHDDGDNVDEAGRVFVPARGFENTHEIRCGRRTVVRSKLTGRNLKVSKTGRVLMYPARRWEHVAALIPPGCTTFPFSGNRHREDVGDEEEGEGEVEDDKEDDDKEDDNKEEDEEEEDEEEEDDDDDEEEASDSWRLLLCASCAAVAALLVAYLSPETVAEVMRGITCAVRRVTAACQSVASPAEEYMWQ
jgi:hypothetical protein